MSIIFDREEGLVCAAHGVIIMRVFNFSLCLTIVPTELVQSIVSRSCTCSLILVIKAVEKLGMPCYEARY